MPSNKNRRSIDEELAKQTDEGVEKALKLLRGDMKKEESPMITLPAPKATKLYHIDERTGRCYQLEMPKGERLSHQCPRGKPHRGSCRVSFIGVPLPSTGQIRGFFSTATHNHPSAIVGLFLHFPLYLMLISSISVSSRRLQGGRTTTPVGRAHHCCGGGGRRCHQRVPASSSPPRRDPWEAGLRHHPPPLHRVQVSD